MKSLSLSRPLVIMIIGLPGSGKSFFARQFADMFAAPLISTDYIRHALAPESSYDAAEDALVGALAQNEVDQLLKTKKTFIIDGGVNTRTARFEVERLANKYGYGTLTIWVQTDEPTSQVRSQRRSAKRSGDELNAQMDSSAFERYRKQFTMPHRSEQIVVISGKHTFATQARVILKKLVAPREEAPVTRSITVTSETNTSTTHDTEPRRHNVTIN